MLSSESHIQECREGHGLNSHGQLYILHHTISVQLSDICACLDGQKRQELLVKCMTVGLLQGSQEVQQRQTLGQ